MKDYSCYLFDADGTLIDTIELIYRCFVHTCGVYGRPIPGRDEVVALVGLPLRKSIDRFFGPVPDGRFEEIRSTHMDYQMSIYRRHLRLFDGVADSLNALRGRGKKLGVVTSRRMPTLALYLGALDIMDCFDVLVTPESTEKHKPDPEPVLEALKQLGVQASQSVYIGDADCDIECGNRAGTDTIFVSWSNTKADRLSAKPTFVIDRLAELIVG